MDRKEYRKSTKLEYEKRVQECIQKIIVEHYNYVMFVDWFMETYDMSKHNGYKYWVKCWEHIKSRFALETDQLITKQLFQLYDLYKDAKEMGDLGTARKVLEDVRKMQGIDQPIKLNVKIEDIKISFGDED